MFRGQCKFWFKYRYRYRYRRFTLSEIEGNGRTDYKNPRVIIYKKRLRKLFSLSTLSYRVVKVFHDLSIRTQSKKLYIMYEE